MKFVDFIIECRERGAPALGIWTDVDYQLTDTALVLTAQELGSKSNSRQEIGSYPLPERVVQLPAPAWIYNKSELPRWGWDMGKDDVIRGSMLAKAGYMATGNASNPGSVLMFASEAREALEEFQRQAIALLDL